MKPPTKAVKIPLSAETPDAMAMAVERGNATTATVSPATKSARRSLARYPSRKTVTRGKQVDETYWIHVKSPSTASELGARPNRPPHKAHSLSAARSRKVEKLHSGDEHTQTPHGAPTKARHPAKGRPGTPR